MHALVALGAPVDYDTLLVLARVLGVSASPTAAVRGKILICESSALLWYWHENRLVQEAGGPYCTRVPARFVVAKLCFCWRRYPSSREFAAMHRNLWC
ncbi:hypothetical protein HOY80DRAFT_194315 [Tuber brumale]|nr:hypothetical protein HOY80DRAFT_194315 [Tuber brumale]